MIDWFMHLPTLYIRDHKPTNHRNSVLHRAPMISSFVICGITVVHKFYVIGQNYRGSQSTYV